MYNMLQGGCKTYKTCNIARVLHQVQNVQLGSHRQMSYKRIALGARCFKRSALGFKRTALGVICCKRIALNSRCFKRPALGARCFKGAALDAICCRKDHLVQDIA
jgi:hypothetical protein